MLFFKINFTQHDYDTSYDRLFHAETGFNSKLHRDDRQHTVGLDMHAEVSLFCLFIYFVIILLKKTWVYGFIFLSLFTNVRRGFGICYTKNCLFALGLIFSEYSDIAEWLDVYVYGLQLLIRETTFDLFIEMRFKRFWDDQIYKRLNLSTRFYIIIYL